MTNLLFVVAAVAVVVFSENEEISDAAKFTSIMSLMLLMFFSIPMMFLFFSNYENHNVVSDSEFELLKEAVSANESAYETIFSGMNPIVFRVSCYQTGYIFSWMSAILEFGCEELGFHRIRWNDWEELKELLENPKLFSDLFEREICWMTGAKWLRKRVNAEV